MHFLFSFSCMFENSSAQYSYEHLLPTLYILKSFGNFLTLAWFKGLPLSGAPVLKSGKRNKWFNVNSRTPLSDYTTEDWFFLQDK